MILYWSYLLLGTDLHNSKTKEYRRRIVNQLYEFSMDFISGIKQAMVCFPSSVRWLVCQVNAALLSADHCDETVGESDLPPD